MKKLTIYCAIFFTFFILLTGQPEVQAEESECTTAIIPGWALPSGRPLMWKSRDVSNWHQEYQYYDLQPYAFIGLNYPFVSYQNECYGGINEAGFAIENSNALNFPDSAGAYDDDGIIMYHALLTCETVDDFLAYMDSTARQGRTNPSNYGVFDAYGGAGILEAAKYTNYWFDASDSLVCPAGYLVRSNFAYNGGTSHVGQYRHDWADTLIRRGMEEGILDARYMFDMVARDLSTETVNPYPLPYSGYVLYQGNYLWGAVRDHNAINRDISMSCFVAEGIASGENPLMTMMWAMTGEPIMTPALPLWMGSYSVPVEMTGDDPDSPMNLRLRELFDYLYYPYPDPYDDVIDTYKLVDGQGGGILVRTREIEESYYDEMVDLTESWRINFPGAAVMTAVQDSLSGYVFDLLYQPEAVDYLQFLPSSANLTMNWPTVFKSFIGDSITVDGYKVYHSGAAYFSSGDSIGFTEDTSFVLPMPGSEGGGFYQVKAVKEWDY